MPILRLARGPWTVRLTSAASHDEGPRNAMSDRTRTSLFALRTVIDEILDSLLVLLIGLEVLVPGSVRA